MYLNVVQESGGTVLSTNWNEIGNKDTTVKAPDGMEYKKWSEWSVKNDLIIGSPCEDL